MSVLSSPDVVPVERVAVVDTDAVALWHRQHQIRTCLRSAYRRLEMAAICAAARWAVDEVLWVRRVRHVALLSVGDRGGGEAEEEGGGDSEGKAHCV